MCVMHQIYFDVAVKVVRVTFSPNFVCVCVFLFSVFYRSHGISSAEFLSQRGLNIHSYIHREVSSCVNTLSFSSSNSRQIHVANTLVFSFLKFFFLFFLPHCE